MFIPFISSKTLGKRKGGGGGGGAKSSGSSSSSSKSGSSSSSSKGSSSRSGSSSLSGKTGSTTSSKSTIYGSSRTISPYSNGFAKVITIPSGLFAGRTAGGATRSQIYGSRTYGSGYPGIYNRGVGGRGFPFFFWPVVWGGIAATTADSAYLYDESEYGSPDNSSRPGGVLMTAAFQSNSTSTIFRIISDNTTMVNLISDIQANCSSSLTSNSASSPSSAVAYNSSASDAPKPEQVVQYFRSSTVALTMDGYNNTSVFASNGTADVDLPSGIDTTLLACLNDTIGVAVPLIDAGSLRLGTPSVGAVGLLWVILYFANFF